MRTYTYAGVRTCTVKHARTHADAAPDARRPYRPRPPTFRSGPADRPYRPRPPTFTSGPADRPYRPRPPTFTSGPADRPYRPRPPSFQSGPAESTHYTAAAARVIELSTDRRTIKRAHENENWRTPHMASQPAGVCRNLQQSSS